MGVARCCQVITTSGYGRLRFLLQNLIDRWLFLNLVAYNIESERGKGERGMYYRSDHSYNSDPENFKKKHEETNNWTTFFIDICMDTKFPVLVIMLLKVIVYRLHRVARKKNITRLHEPPQMVATGTRSTMWQLGAGLKGQFKTQA